MEVLAAPELLEAMEAQAGEAGTGQVAHAYRAALGATEVEGVMVDLVGLEVMAELAVAA
jgi:hypothetical protein